MRVNSDAENECMTTPRGSGYHGTLAVSATGRPCSRWSTVSNISLVSSLVDSDVENVKNYCRTLTSSQYVGPSCVTQTVGGQNEIYEREEQCAVQFCGKNNYLCDLDI
jgi:hypothetical protein